MSEHRSITGSSNTIVQFPDHRFDPKKGIASTRTSELVIALCGPIGSPLHKVAETIKDCLITDFGYEVCDIIRLSQIIKKHNEDIKTGSSHKQIRKLIELGDQMRRKYGSGILSCHPAMRGNYGWKPFILPRKVSSDLVSAAK